MTEMHGRRRKRKKKKRLERLQPEMQMDASLRANRAMFEGIRRAQRYVCCIGEASGAKDAERGRELEGEAAQLETDT